MLVERVHGFRRFDDAIEHGDALLAADVERAGLAASVDEALDAVVAGFDAREVLIAIVFEQEVDRAPVARPHRRHDVAVERARQDARRAAVGGDDCEVMRRVVDELGIAARRRTRARARRDASSAAPSHEVSPLSPWNVVSSRGVAPGCAAMTYRPNSSLRSGSVAALAEERDLLAVGRPRGPAFVVAARRQDFRFAARDVEHI